MLEKLNSSIEQDKRMYSEDIDGSKAYAKCLKNISLLTNEEYEKICDGLETVRLEWDQDSFVVKNDEDVHSANERRLKVILTFTSLIFKNFILLNLGINWRTCFKVTRG